ncbi:unnamed protein product [Rotaria magnacalcarata]|uniref:FHA domain-containing protein n=1 Tax=Rotaria magnacalcarata TaxID=392030 RepID=A0A814MUF7_9BILA|nr:unnamed protein product [Rotaria magnacalcarata]
MKGFLHSQDGSYAFPLGPKVTTIGRENCDISINSNNVDNQHALIEFDDEQRCFILKDLNSSTGTYVHDCRVQNAAVRLNNEDVIRFGFNGLPLEFKIEQQQQQQQQHQETTMPSIYQRQSSSNSLQLIKQTIPSRRVTSGITNHQQQIDVRQNPGFSLRGRPSSAGNKRAPAIVTNTSSHGSNGIRDSLVRPNAWTLNSNTSNVGRSIINGNFTGELDVPCPDNTEITNRVDQLEKEVKGRDAEIRELNDRLRSLEPLNSTFTNEVHTLRSELEKVKREKQAATGLISSVQRDLHAKESELAKITREIEGMKSDSRDKDLRLQSLQAKLNLLRDRGRAEEDRYTKEKELKIKLAEQQINELNESVNRLKSQLQDTEKQLLRLNQNELKLKQECEHAREQLVEVQRNETKLKVDLANAEKKYNQFCINIWKCFSNDDDDEYDEDNHNIMERIQQLQRQLDQSQSEVERLRDINLSSNEQLRGSLGKFIDILTSAIKEQTTAKNLLHARQQMIELEEAVDNDSIVGMFKQAAINIVDSHARFISGINNLVIQRDNQQEDLPTNEILALIRRQYEELEREKDILFLDHTAREQTFRSELEKITAEKDAFWQQRFNDECARLRQENTQLRNEYDEQTRSFSGRLETVTAQSSEYVQRWNILQTESSQKVDELTTQLQEYQRELSEHREQVKQLTGSSEKQKEEFIRMEKEKNATIQDLNGQMEVYKDQVRQFSKTIIQLEKNVAEEQERRIKLQTELDNVDKNRKVNRQTPPVSTETIVPIVSVPVADLSHELFTHKSRIQEQEQIIISLRRDLAGMTARLSDVQGELSEKQKRALEKSEFTIRDQTKELNDTRVKLSKLSDIVDKQSAQIESLQLDLSKSKILANQYQLLVDQRQADIDRLTRSLDEKNLLVERVEQTNQNEGRITHELVAIGAQCKGERHDQTIGRQREALNELRARIKSLEQSRPTNPSYEKVLQQVVLLKRELAELRARQSLPADIPYLITTPGSNSFHQQSTTSFRQSPAVANASDVTPEAQKIIEERTAHAETMNALQSCDELHNTFTRKLVQLLDIDDDTLLNVSPLATMSPTDRYVAIQQRRHIIEALLQKVEMLRERLTRKEELLLDYEKDLGKLRQAEILLREKDLLLQDLETNKRSKDDESLFLRNTLKETQDHLNQEKRLNTSIKHNRNIDQSQSNELIRRSGNSISATAPHDHYSSESTTKIRTVKRDMNQKLSRKDYEIKTLKQELHEALDTLSEQSNKVKLLELQSKDMSNGTNFIESHHS